MLLIIRQYSPLGIITYLPLDIENSLLFGYVYSNTLVRDGEDQLLLVFVIEDVDYNFFVGRGLFDGVLGEVD